MYKIIVIYYKGYSDVYIYDSNGKHTFYWGLAKKFFPEEIPAIMDKLMTNGLPYSIRLVSIPE